MKHCIVIWIPHWKAYEAYDENARLIARRGDWNTLIDWLSSTYETIPNNTRFAKTILDKINQHHI